MHMPFKKRLLTDLIWNLHGPIKGSWTRYFGLIFGLKKSVFFIKKWYKSVFPFFCLIL